MKKHLLTLITLLGLFAFNVFLTNEHLYYLIYNIYNTNILFTTVTISFLVLTVYILIYFLIRKKHTNYMSVLDSIIDLYINGCLWIVIGWYTFATKVANHSELVSLNPSIRELLENLFVYCTYTVIYFMPVILCIKYCKHINNIK